MCISLKYAGKNPEDLTNRNSYEELSSSEIKRSSASPGKQTNQQS